jgi:hypothetical protein
MINLETYGDLKKLIDNIKLKQKGQKIISKGKEFALDQVLGFIPGASNAKTIFSFIQTAISKPDSKKTNTWLDKLDIDDEMSAIVDDTVENGFMQAMADAIQKEPDNKPLEDDFNMNQKMVNYLKEKYKQRTVTGIKENMKTQQLRKLIREIILSETEPTQPKTEPTQIQGQINIELFKKLKIEDFDPGNFSTTINLVKNNKSLNMAANKVLADTMVALIKTDDDTLLNQIFSNLKQVKSS